jgi:hypothetical protein
MAASIERVAQSTGFRAAPRGAGGGGQHRLPGQTKQTIIGFSRLAR